MWRDTVGMVCEHPDVGEAQQIFYQESLSGIESTSLQGFFEGWPKRPSPSTLFRLLKGGDHVVLAVDQSSGMVVGFVTALSDGVLTAYIPLLEVLPNYQGIGIGSELMNRMLKVLEELYMVDLVCDPGLEGFYSRFGFSAAFGMSIRRYDRQDAG